MSQDNTATPSGRILIVADDMMLRELMKDALVRDDYIIEEVDNGLDALAAVRNSEPDMILLDVKIPGMSGFEVCSEIRTNLNMQGISVVMITGLEDSESIEKAFSLGATAFINKPINSISFRYQIQYLLKAKNAFVELKEREIHLAHDFGNLMKIAKGNLELLDESFVEQNGIDSESMDILDDARSAIHDSVELTKKLLASARRKSIAPEYLNIRDTILNFSKLFKNALGDKIELSIHIENDLPDILVDSAQFESSLLNVVINARDAMPDGGILSIDAEDINCPYGLPNHSDESGSTDRYVHIYIEDSGTGMNSEVLRHATEPFFTTKKDAGTGLGLSMVYGFMRQSMGELGIESEPGQGTRITMQFPDYGDKKIPPAQSSSHYCLGERSHN